ncbi:MAG TPA: hypothetical protein VF277_06175 [Steroidobacteraceae bacterium]
MSNPYLQPVPSRWARIAGVVLLAAGVGLMATLLYTLYEFMGNAGERRSFTSSSLLFALVLVTLCAMCWQAGYRLACGSAARFGSLFSRPAWFAIGLALTVLTALMAGTIIASRGLTLLDVQVILFLGGIGVWCLVLAMKRSSDVPRDEEST